MMRLDDPPPVPAHSEDDLVVASESDEDEAISDEDNDDDDDDEDDEDEDEDGDDEDEDEDEDYNTLSADERGLPLERELPAVVGSDADDAPLPVPGRSTPAMGPANPLLEMLHAPPDGGSRKRKRGMHPEADAQGPMALRMPMVTPFAADAWSDLVLRPWSESAAKVLRPRKGYMQHQPNITHTLRVALIDWLIEVVEVYRFRVNTLYAAVNYLDRFLSRIAIERDVLQLTGVTCLMLAAKYEEVNPPCVEEFVYITDSAYTRETILKMECAILDVLKFELRVDSPLNYTEILLKAADACDSARELCAFLIMLTTVDAERYLGADPVIVAAAAVVIALDALHGCALPLSLARALSDSGIAFGAVHDMATMLHRTHCVKKELSASLHSKFSNMEHHRVARLRPSAVTPSMVPPRPPAPLFSMALRPRKRTVLARGLVGAPGSITA